jgi:hypothetical protein
MGVRGDLRLLEMAVRRRFNIDTEKAAREVNQLMSDPDPRVQLRALGIAALMESMNQKDEHKVIDGQLTARDSELSRIASDLGIDPRLIVDGSIQTDRSVVGTTQPTEAIRPGK